MSDGFGIRDEAAIEQEENTRQDVLDILTDDSVHAIAEIVMRKTGQGMSAGDLNWLNDAVWPALEMILPSTIEMRPDTPARVTLAGTQRL